MVISWIWPLRSWGLLWNWSITWKIIKNWNLKLLIPFRILMTAPCATFRIKIARLNLKLFHSNLPVSKIIVYIKWYWTCSKVFFIGVVQLWVQTFLQVGPNMSANLITEGSIYECKLHNKWVQIWVQTWSQVGPYMSANSVIGRSKYECNF